MVGEEEVEVEEGEEEVGGGDFTPRALIAARAAAAATASVTAALSEAYTCCICTDTCVDPATASCGQHNFCLSCLKAWIAEKRNTPGGATCPTCRVRIQQSPQEVRVNVGIKEAILAAQKAAEGGSPAAGRGGGGVQAAGGPTGIAWKPIRADKKKNARKT